MQRLASDEANTYILFFLAYLFGRGIDFSADIRFGRFAIFFRAIISDGNRRASKMLIGASRLPNGREALKTISKASREYGRRFSPLLS